MIGSGFARLLRHGISEFLVDLPVHLPVRLPEDRAHESDMAKRPETLVRKAIIIAVLLLLGEPYPAQRIARVVRRNGDPVVPVD